MAEELTFHSPMWVEYSGLPEELNKQIRNGAWSVFKKLMELDCQSNNDPDTFEVSVEDLGRMVGMDTATVRRILVRLRQKKYIVCFIPENVEEVGLFKINVPLSTPLSPRQVKRKFSHCFPPGKDFFRYADKHIIETEGDDPRLQELIDIYLNTIGLKINVFVIDELCLIKERFDWESVKEAFAQARERKIKKIRWVVNTLLREDTRGDDRKKKKKEGRIGTKRR